MPRAKSPGTLHKIWRIEFLREMTQDAMDTGHYGLAIRLGDRLKDAERDLRGHSRAERN